MYTGLQCEGWITIYFWIPHSHLILSWSISFFGPFTSEKLPFGDVRLVGWWVKSVRANPDYENFCQKWDSNPRPQKWTATWTQRLRPLRHPDYVSPPHISRSTKREDLTMSTSPSSCFCPSIRQKQHSNPINYLPLMSLPAGNPLVNTEGRLAQLVRASC